MKTIKDYISINESKVKTDITKYDYIAYEIPKHETDSVDWWGPINADEFKTDTSLREMFSDKTFDKLSQLSKNESIIITESGNEFVFVKLK